LSTKKPKIFKKKEKKQLDDEKLILEFLEIRSCLNKFMKKTNMRDLFFKVFGDKTEYLLALI